MTYPAASWRALRALGVPFPVPRPPRVLEAPAAVWRRVLDVLEAQVARHVAAAERTVCLDFDGTLTQPVPYTPGEATAPPRPGLVRALRALRGAGYRLVVLTARPPGEVHGWLHRHQVAAYIDEVTNTKPPAAAYVDDRGVTFDGDWGAVHTEIERLQHTEPRPVAGNDAGTGLHAEWDEDKHPRDAKGQFSETGAITLERLPPFRGPHAMREATIIDGETGHGVMQEGASHGELVERLRERGLPLRTYVRGMVPEERQAATGAVIELIGPVAELAPMAAAFLRERRPNMYVLVGYG
ncbi:MAG TPA: hypothetical protein VJ598_05910, partial [Albitalea sp.]|nr:hypothetical protein [Albitalea sp.]